MKHFLLFLLLTSIFSTEKDKSNEKILESFHSKNKIIDHKKMQQDESNETTELTGSCGTDANYIIDKISGNVTIYGTGEMEDFTSDTSPFCQNNQYVKHLFINEDITSIGRYAYYNCTLLQSVDFPKTLKTIELYSFSSCILLESVIIKNNITLKNYCFMGCSSLSYLFYNGSKYNGNNGNYMFSNCPKLISVDVVYNFQSEKFYNKSVNRIFPDTEEIKGETERFNTYTYFVSNSTLFIDCGAMMQDANSFNQPYQDFKYTAKYVIFDYATYIGGYAFYEYTMESVYFSDSLLEIGDSAFLNCKNLKTINIPKKLYKIGRNSFAGCISLPSFDVSLVRDIGNGAFTGCSLITSFNISSVTKLGNAFSHCTGLISIEIPNGIELICDHIFEGCSNLTSILLPDTATKIGIEAMYKCSSLLEITIPQNVTEIGTNAFRYCTSLKSITINEVINIKFGSNVFANCSSLSTFLYKGRNTPENNNGDQFIGSNLLKSIDVLYYYRSTTFLYKPVNRRDPDAPTYSGSCGENMTYVYDVSSCTLTIKGSGKMRNFADFRDYSYYCKTVNCEGNFTTIEDNALKSLYYVTSINLIDSIDYIGNSAFRYCESLQNIHIPENLTKINPFVFESCSSLISIDLPKSIRSIDYNAFKYCISLKSIDISSVNYTGSNSFGYCISLTSINISSMATIKYGSFEACSNLTSIRIPKMVTSIEHSTFAHCISLKSVIIEGDIQTIGQQAFYNCTSLSHFVYEGYKTPTITSSSFISCNNLNIIIVKDYYESDKFGEFNVTTDEFIESSETIESTKNDEIITETIESTKNDEIITETTDEQPSTNDDQSTEGSIDSNECNENAPIGCLHCDENNQSKCISCNTNQHFNETVNSEGKCQCIENYELSENNQCVPMIGNCNQSVKDIGCSSCYLYDQSICAICDEERGFNKEPTSSNRCTCSNPDFNISNGQCVELSVDCVWGELQPVLGCKLCNGVRPYQCTVCDESKGLVINENHICVCKNESYILNSQGECVLPSSNCNEEDMIGCLKCSENNDHQCIACDTSKGFILKSDKCVCENEGYEVNQDGICVSTSDIDCSPDIQIYGCLKCSSSNNQQCTLCDTTLNFNSNPENGICTCVNGYSLGVNGECFVYVEEEPVLSFPEYTETEKIPDNCITPNGDSMTIDTSNLDKDTNKLYDAKIDDNVNTVEVKNQDEKLQITISDRKDTPLNVVIDQDQQVQLNTSNSNFPISLPSNSQKVSIVVDSDSSTLEVNSNEKEATDVNLGNISVSKQSLVLKPKTNVIVEYVNLFGESQLTRNTDGGNDDKSASLIAKKVNLQKGSVSKISNVLISEELNLAPNSVIKINEGVGFSQANFSIYKANKQQIDYSYLEFANKVTEFPNQILIKEMESNGFLSDDKDSVIIFHQKAEILSNDMCMKWAERVETSGGYKGRCVENDKINKGDNSVYAVKGGVQEKPGENKDPKKSGGLDKAAIIGIAVAAVVVVAVIVVVVVVVVIKKKRGSKSSTEDYNNNGLDL